MPSYKTIQVTKREYELLIELKNLILRQGTDSIEKTIDRGFNIDRAMEDMNRTSLAKGAVAGIAIALTLHLLRKEREKENSDTTIQQQSREQQSSGVS